MEIHPKIGVGIMLLKNNKILLGKRNQDPRKASSELKGQGTWTMPGGKIRFGEKYQEAAYREVLEEAGIKIKNIEFATITNDIFEKDNKHYITVFMTADYDSGEIEAKESFTKDWNWFSWDNLPAPLMTPIQNLLKTNFNPFN